jgi:RNA recognition motif-containing protein
VQIRASFSKLAQVRDLKLIRDKVSLTSRGFAFIEFSSTEEAQKALRKSMNLKIEDAPVRCAYSRKDHLLEHGEPRNFNQRERGGGKGQGPQSMFLFLSLISFHLSTTANFRLLLLSRSSIQVHL